VLSRWRRWRARRLDEALIKQVAQRLIWESGYDVKTAAEVESFRAEARQVIASALHKEDGR